jgi:hypothetical protein
MERSNVQRNITTTRALGAADRRACKAVEAMTRKAAGLRRGGTLRFVIASKHFGRILGDAWRLTNQFSPDSPVKPICALEGRTGVIK